MPMSPEMAAKAQKRATRKAAKRIRGSEQSDEHKRKRFASMFATLAVTPRLCPGCGENFIRTTAGQRFCSSRCWLRIHRKQKPRERKFTIPIEEYRRLLALQDNRCAICRALSGSNGRKDRLAVDHCHDRNVGRGLLCHRCNTALGLLRDDVEIVESAIRYLKEHAPPMP